MSLMKAIVLSVMVGLFTWNTGMAAGVFEDPLLKARIPVSAKERELLYKTSSTTYYPNIVARFGLLSTDLMLFNQNIQAEFGRSFNYNIPFGGISYYFPVKIRKIGSFDVNVDYSYFLHQDLKNTNLQEGELWGFAAGFGVGRDVFPSNKHFDLIISSGIQFGRLRYRFSNYATYAGSGTNDINTKNFLCPQLTIYPRWVRGYLVIGFRASYKLDLLANTWEGTPISAQLGTSSATGWTAEAVIGMQLGIYR
ncbi:MAG TPA: hypothetical protein VGO45_01300 [Bacteroidia bacterium]|jgi:hypothetical protein|nr:hypothetical protein [Bacteroidia bacterium]